MVHKVSTVEEYIASFPEDVQVILENVRATIRRVVPEAGEKISYQMPMFTVDGKYLVYFAAWKNHVSMYPIPAEVEGLEEELTPYRAAKNTVKFPLGKPLPYGLIERLVRYLNEHRDPV